MIIVILCAVFLIVFCLLAVGYIQHVREQRRLARVRALSAAHAQILRMEQLENALPECLRSPVVLRLLMVHLQHKLGGALDIDPKNPYLLKHAERVDSRLAHLAGTPATPLPERLKVNGLSQEKATSINTAIGELNTLASGLREVEGFDEFDRRGLRALLEFARLAVPLELMLQQAAMYQTVRNLNTSQKLLRRASDTLAAHSGDQREAMTGYDRVIQERLEQVSRELLEKVEYDKRSAAQAADRDGAEGAGDNPLMAALDRQIAESKSL